jgi:hypothetical protein
MTEFTDSEFMTADEKTKVLRQWRAFVKSGFEQKKFTKAIYKHLNQHCSFIAHYDLGGFYATYFGQSVGNMTVKFINQFDRAAYPPGISVEYGSDYWLTDKRYADINGAMVDVMTEYATDLRRQAIDAYKDTLSDRIRALQDNLDALSTI